jgi:hypothetical protein
MSSCLSQLRSGEVGQFTWRGVRPLPHLNTPIRTSECLSTSHQPVLSPKGQHEEDDVIRTKGA